MKAVSIGFHRADGDFQILATMNNKDDLIPQGYFEKLVQQNTEELAQATEEAVFAIEREDAPDYVFLDPELLGVPNV